MGDPSDNIIDLTSPFSLVKHCNFSNDIIEIDDDTDESFRVEIIETNNTNKISKQSGAKSLEPRRLENETPEKNKLKIGECPICCDQLGKKPASSTKCGHVFCLQCIERSLRYDKKCPQCRRVLKGPSAYHPLYLPLQ
ncbi:E3 ubiquitin-protein ligase RNF4-like [Zerene cesonia]|uniref:E3 ubiquitin-protein ligase RNF4-like n=1 Tax=Zerene cesonia TaxID=33412 RepID=UPI0018E59246|nr:E3 ubiquitin-protein ligase RNF4-like [Zerene cesonia]